ncbi:MAG: endonuclease/exonuclease/phosphatase family protein [Rhodothermales bacterium]
MRLLKRIALIPAVLLLALAIVFAWASSGTLPDEALATVTIYDDTAFRQAAPGDTFTVVAYNLGYLSGMTNNLPVKRSAALFNAHMDAATALLRRADADLVAFQEIDFGAARSYYVHQLDTLAQRLGYATSAAAVNWDERYLPFPSANPLMHFGRVLSGQAVLSRYPVRRHERIALERPPSPFYYDAFYIDRLAQIVEVDLGRALVIINVHLEAWDTATRERQAEALRALYLHYRTTHPVLLIGDFNSLLPLSKNSPSLSPTQRAYFADDRTMEILLHDTALREAFADSIYATREAETFTSPATAPNKKIDHLLYDAAKLDVVEAFVIGGPDQPSDHRAVAMRFVFKN